MKQKDGILNLNTITKNIWIKAKWTYGYNVQTHIISIKSICK